MDELKKQVVKPSNLRLYVTRDNLATFGESTSRGRITEDCIKSMHARDMQVPKWAISSATHQEIIMRGRRPVRLWRSFQVFTSTLAKQIYNNIMAGKQDGG